MVELETQVPLLSICCITYNHEKYISQAVEGFLMQECNFDFEIVIGEDCSTDRTREILLEYKRKFPNKIRLVFPEQNLGPAGNFINTFDKCKGKYVAFCEGDDFWIDVNKLQFQVDFLEENPEFSTCFHTVYELKNGEKTLSEVEYSKNDGVYTIYDFALRSFIFTLSIVFRNNLKGEFPIWFKDCALPDFGLHMLNGRFGKFKGFNKPMAVYRIHETGIFSMRSHEYKVAAIEKTIEVLNPHFDEEIRDIFRLQKQNLYEHLIRYYYLDKECDKAETYLNKAIENNPEFAQKAALEILPLIIKNIYQSNRYKMGDRLASLFKFVKMKKD
jgi:glycosyltransferase involved in cell wall biosynthesis